MRLPINAITENLAWGRDGAVWATYQVLPTSYPYLTTRDKIGLHARMRAAFSVLPPESMLLGVARRISEEELGARLCGGTGTGEAWRAEAGAFAAELAQGGVQERRFYVSVRLPDTGLRAGTEILAGIRIGLLDAFGVGPARVGAQQHEARTRQAELIRSQLAAHVDLTPVSSAELRWLYARAPLRGLTQPAPKDFPQRTRAEGAELAALNEAIYYEGGTAEDTDRPPHRRYLRVDSLQGPSFQAFLAVCDMPREFTFPGGGSEWFRALDELPFPVDWCARVVSIDNARAQLSARRQARQLAGQFEQHDGDTAGAPRSLADAVAGVDDEQAELAATHEPELRATFILCVAQPTLRRLEEAAAQLQAHWAGAEYGLARPTGGQSALFQAMLPGSPLPQAAKDYVQYLLPRDLAAGMPFTGCDIGDTAGMPLGISLDTGALKPVVFDPALGPSQSRSGSVGVAGNLGSGKSYFIKRVAHATLARGGRVIALDRTERGEYVAFATAAPGSSQVITLQADSPICADPMRLFTGPDRVAYTTGFLSLLTQTAPADPAGVALTEAVHAAAAAPTPTIHGVIEQLERIGEHDEEARRLARKIRALARNPHGAVVFGGEDRPSLQLDADYLVLHLPSLVLPTREQMDNPALAGQLLPEQLFSQAVLYLAAAIIRSVTFSQWNRFAAALLDEAWALTASLQGQQLILDFIRDGRKHNAAVWLISQHADDLGDGQIAHLLGSRFVFRQDPGAVSTACRFLGVEETPAVRDLLQTAQPGQCLYRDLLGRIGAVHVLPAFSPLHEALNTTPTAQPDAPAPERPRTDPNSPPGVGRGVRRKASPRPRRADPVPPVVPITGSGPDDLPPAGDPADDAPVLQAVTDADADDLVLPTPPEPFDDPPGSACLA